MHESRRGRKRGGGKGTGSVTVYSRGYQGLHPLSTFDLIHAFRPAQQFLKIAFSSFICYANLFIDCQPEQSRLLMTMSMHARTCPCCHKSIVHTHTHTTACGGGVERGEKAKSELHCLFWGPWFPFLAYPNEFSHAQLTQTHTHTCVHCVCIYLPTNSIWFLSSWPLILLSNSRSLQIQCRVDKY